MSETSQNRRKLLGGLVLGAATLPLIRSLDVLAAEAALPHLSTTDTTAQALGYTENAAKIDPTKEAAYKKGSKCESCVQYQSAKAKGGYGPCNAFPGKLVNANGWCRAYAAKA